MFQWPHQTGRYHHKVHDTSPRDSRLTMTSWRIKNTEIRFSSGRICSLQTFDPWMGQTADLELVWWIYGHASLTVQKSNIDTKNGHIWSRNHLFFPNHHFGYLAVSFREANQFPFKKMMNIWTMDISLAAFIRYPNLCDSDKNHPRFKIWWWLTRPCI